MVKLYDIVDRDDLEECLKGRYVNANRHPRLPLTIYNYSKSAQYDAHWTPTTVNCRGLIVHDDGTVIARPFKKFFNFGQVDTPTGPVVVTDKADGSCGIVYRDGDRLCISTRGSFVSEQAQHATEVLNARYGDFDPPANWTYVFEIIYPENRVVVNYGSFDDLVLLGAVDIETGRSVALEEAASYWSGPVVETFPYTSLEEALAAPAREDREGLVLHFTDPDERIKIKQEDYVRLARLMSGITGRAVYMSMKHPETHSFEAVLERAPDEVYNWIKQTKAELQAQFDAIVKAGFDLHNEVEAKLASMGVSPADPTYRREYAKLVESTKDPRRFAAYAARDGQAYNAWSQITPPATRMFLAHDEDAD